MVQPSDPDADFRPGDTLLALAREPGAWTGEDVLERSRRYVRDGRVREIEIESGTLTARVDGRRKTPYKVRVDVSGAEPVFSCSCPYDGDPLCKHGAAALIEHLRRLEEEGPLPEPRARAERRRQARRESWTVRNVGAHRYLSTFEVRGDSGRTYTVEIRDPGGLVNRCTCPDHRINLLGTCKHVEAVLERLRRRAPVKMERLAEGPPPFGQLLVRWDGPPRVALQMPSSASEELRRFREEHFDAEGLLRTGGPAGSGENDGQVQHTRRAALLATIPSLLEAAEAIDDLRVCDDVRELLDTERQAARRAQASVELARRLREQELRCGEELGVAVRLYPYQADGVAFLASRGRAILADDMGLGKTLQALTAFAVLRRRGLARRALVVCPASLKHQWKEEAERFTDLSVQVIEGRPPDREALYRRRAELTVVNYELVLRDRDAIGAELGADLLVLDEAQRIRNWRTKTAAAVKALDTEYAFVLTGTPLQNRLEDLYSLMQVVDPRVLGPLWSFRHRYVRTEPERGQVLGYRNLHELRRRLEPVVLRRTRAEVLEDLPGLVVNRFRVELTPEQRGPHDEAEYQIAILAAIARRRKLTPAEEKRLLALMNMARMSCDTASLLDRDWWEREHLPEVVLDEALRWPKLRELRRVLDDLCVDKARKVVVFTEWRRMQRLAEAVADDLGLDPVALHGGVPSGSRGELIARFRDEPACRVFLSTDAGGVGLNLQMADAVVVLDLPWNPAVLSQRVARVHRHGQAGSVHLLQIISRDCFEERLERLLEGKRTLFEAALGDSDLTEMPRPSTSAQMARVAMEAYGGDGGSSQEPGGIEAAATEPAEADAGETRGEQGPAAAAPEGAGGPAAAAPEGAEPPAAAAPDEETPPVSRTPLEESPDGASESEDQAGGARRSAARRHRGFADRQVEAAEVLAGAGLGGSALVSIHSSVRAELLAALAEVSEDGIPDEPGHDWLVEQMHRRLVPERLALEEASLLGQARDLAAAFGSSSSVPAGLAEPLLERMEALRERLRGT